MKTQNWINSKTFAAFAPIFLVILAAYPGALSSSYFEHDLSVTQGLYNLDHPPLFTLFCRACKFFLPFHGSIFITLMAMLGFIIYILIHSLFNYSRRYAYIFPILYLSPPLLIPSTWVGAALAQTLLYLLATAMLAHHRLHSQCFSRKTWALFFIILTLACALGLELILLVPTLIYLSMASSPGDTPRIRKLAQTLLFSILSISIVLCVEELTLGQSFLLREARKVMLLDVTAITVTAQPENRTSLSNGAQLLPIHICPERTKSLELLKRPTIHPLEFQQNPYKLFLLWRNVMFKHTKYYFQYRLSRQRELTRRAVYHWEFGLVCYNTQGIAHSIGALKAALHKYIQLFPSRMGRDFYMQVHLLFMLFILVLNRKRQLKSIGVALLMNIVFFTAMLSLLFFGKTSSFKLAGLSLYFLLFSIPYLLVGIRDVIKGKR